MSFVAELYYSIFVLSFRANAWNDGAIKMGVGLGGVTLVQTFLLLTLSDWYEYFVGREIVAEWMVVLGYFLLLCGNYWVLYKSGRGVSFEQRFDDFPKTKRVFLRSTALVVVIAVFSFSLWSAGLYRTKFGHG